MRVADEQGNIVREESPITGVVDAPQAVVEDISNPLGEPTIRVKVRPGVEFFNQGVLRANEEEFDMPVSMARHASMYVRAVQPDGSTGSVPPAAVDVTKANIAGRPRHERIGELQSEIDRLEARKAEVQAQLDHESAAQAAAVQSQATGQPVGGAVAVAPGLAQPGAVATTSEHPRPGEDTQFAQPKP